MSLADETEQVVLKLTLQLKQFISTVRKLSLAPDEAARSMAQQEAIQSLDHVLETDKTLQNVLDRVGEYQKLYSSLQTKSQQLETSRQKLIQLTRQVYSEIIQQKHVIEQSIYRLNRLKALNSKVGDPDQLIALAQQLSYSAGPPADWIPGQPLGGLHRSPYPTEDLMRATKLFEIMNIPNAANHQLAMPSMEDHPTKEIPIPTTINDQLHPKNTVKKSQLPLGFLDLDLNPDLV